jgi:hypothetical protein
VVRELYDAVVPHRPPVPQRQEIFLAHQVAAQDASDDAGFPPDADANG